MPNQLMKSIRLFLPGNSINFNNTMCVCVKYLCNLQMYKSQECEIMFMNIYITNLVLELLKCIFLLYSKILLLPVLEKD